MRPLLSVATVFALAATSACMPPPTVEIRRSALVPAATPIDRSGASMGDNLLEAAVGGDMATGDPSSRDPESGVVIPGAQTRGGLRFRVPRLETVDFGVNYTRLHSKGAVSIVDQPVPDEDGAAYSANMLARLPLGDEGFFLGVATEVSFYSLPYLVYERCIDNCIGKPFSNVSSYRSIVPGFGVGLIPNFRAGPITFFGQMTARTHPDIDRIDVVTGYVVDPGGPDAGPMVVILGGGLEAELPAGFRIGLRGHLVTSGPVAYKPAVSAMLTIPLVRQASSARAR